MKFRTLHVLFLAGLALLVLPSDETHGQARGFITGQVVDEDGNPIEGVTIRMEAVDIGRKYKVKTKKDGKYLHAGVSLQSLYRVIAEKEGYQTDYVQGVKPGFDRSQENRGEKRGVHDFTLRKGTSGKLAFEMTEEEKLALEKQRAEQEKRGTKPGGCWRWFQPRGYSVQRGSI